MPPQSHKFVQCPKEVIAEKYEKKDPGRASITNFQLLVCVSETQKDEHDFDLGEPNLHDIMWSEKARHSSVVGQSSLL